VAVAHPALTGTDARDYDDAPDYDADYHAVTMSSFLPETVFITGASSGFGAAVTRRFAAAGVRVVAAARRADRLKELAAEFGPRLLPLTLDVRDREAVAAAVAHLPAEFAAIDLLVNNAGLALGLHPAQDADLDDWDQMIDTNCKGLVYCTRALLPGMVARRRGHVINLGSVAGSYPYPGGNVYGGTKAFVHQFSLDLRSDLHGTGVRVTCVEPGMADTEFSLVRFSGDRARADDVYAGMQPLTPDDVAESVFWAAGLPPHVNVNTIELMPTAQSFAPFQVAREG
jgi:3-hydroxy acid dehydrogenase/malonic semialdehyde reductase